jgi:hypothetical protein
VRSKNIMHSTKLLLLAASFIAGSALPLGFAAQQSLFPAPGDLTLEMADYAPPSHYPIPPVGIYPIVFFEFKRLENWRRPPNQASDLCAIQMFCRRQGDAIRIDLEVIFGRPGPGNGGPIEGARVESAGTYVIRLGESASLQELARFGIEPIRVKVVSADSHTLNPAQIGNKTKAIEVVRVDQAREYYRVVLKNISSKNIVGGRVSFFGGASMGIGLQAPGQVWEMPFYFDESHWLAAQDKSEKGPVPPKIVVSSVVFDDSTFEGDLEPALACITKRRAVRIQAIRIVDLLQAAIGNAEQDSSNVLEKLRQQLSGLDERPDIQVLNDLAERFGPFTVYQRNGLLGALKDGLRDTKQGMLERMRLYEKREAPKGTSLQSWLRTMKGHYEELIKKL